MGSKIIYEYAIIRLVPRVEREEFINIGVILFCKKLNYIKAHIKLESSKILALFPNADVPFLEKYVENFHCIVSGMQGCGPIAAMDVPSRFRWLTAKRSTVIQISAIHSGLTSDPDATLLKVFNEMVL